MAEWSRSFTGLRNLAILAGYPAERADRMVGDVFDAGVVEGRRQVLEGS